MRRDFLWAVFVCYAVLLVRVVLLKYHHFIPVEGTYWDRLAERVAQGNYAPFSTIAAYATGAPTWRIAVRNVLGNVVIFLPLGTLLPLLSRRFGSWKRVALAAFCVSLAFECLQILFIIGTFDVDDLLLNTLGALLGYAGLKALRPSSPTR